jgi:RHS repeat-associated protein
MALAFAMLLSSTAHFRAATFPGNASIEVADPSGALTWNSNINALTVSCWFKLSIPSGVSVTQDMAILVNRRTGTLNDPHAFAIYLNHTTGNVEFSSHGTGSEAPRILIERPYLERPYHVAVIRDGSNLHAYVDGREVLNVATAVGDSHTTDGVSIGGWGNGNYLLGEVQEVAIYQAALSQEFITQYLFSDQPTASFPDELKGYYKLAFSQTTADELKNFAVNPATGSNPATTQGSGPVLFDQTDRRGEQSLFDSRRNGGRDAITPLAGGYSWEQTVFTRPTAGVPFEFQIGYNSGNVFNSNSIGTFDPFSDSVLGSGWRHSFETRVIPSNYFDPVGGTDVIGILSWDGSLEVWEDPNFTGEYQTRHGEYRGELRFPSLTVCELVTPDRLIYKFQSPFSGTLLMRGRLLQVRDFNGNAINLTWDTSRGRLTTATDTGGGVWRFNYNAQNLLTSVTGPTDDAASKWTVAFTFTTANSRNVLATKSITGPAAYTSVTSTQWEFRYNTQGLLDRIIDPRHVGSNIYNAFLTYDTYGRKVQQQDALGRTTQFEYNAPALRQIRTTRLHGTNAALNRTTIDTFDRKLHLLSRKDPLGFTTSYEYDAFGNVTKATDARQVPLVMTYDSRSNMLTRTNVLGEKTTWVYAEPTDPAGSTNGHLSDGTLLNKPLKEVRPATTEASAGWQNRFEYDSAGNLRFHRDGPVGGADFGTLAEYNYDARGLAISSKDANGNETRFTYDSTTGFLTSRTIAFGTPQAATWNITAQTELGWVLTENNPLTEATSYGYNVNGQLVSKTDPLRTFTKSYDANGNLTAESDGKGVNTNYSHDDADQRISRTDRSINTWNYSYTPFGEIETTTTPAAISDGTSQRLTLTRSYDNNGRLTKETDPYGKFVSYEYDENGNQTAAVDKVQHRWEKSYDPLNRITSERDPLLDTKITSYDAAGRVHVVTSPNGYPSVHEYDGRGRLTKWTDPDGFSWIYQYDGVGNILDIEDALHGHYVMTYGPRNERLTEQNQDNKTWNYTYDPLVRLKTQLDPNGTLRTLSYDTVRRLYQVDFNSGRRNSFQYDNNDNVTNVTRTKNGSPTTTLGLSYDALDRLTDSQDTFGQPVHYNYDAISRVASKVYPGAKTLTQSYDRLGRLTKLSFPAGSATYDCTFAYDDADRLISRIYPNGVTQTKTFDSADRIASLGYGGAANPAIALSYAYDRNGNKTSGSEKGTLGWAKTSVADYSDTSRFKPDGKLIDRTDTAAAGGPRTFTYNYDDSGNMTLATAAGESYALVYDEDNRTTSITWDVGITEKQILNRYDGLGRRVSRAVDGVETRYVLDLTGDMERILCDTDAAGSIQAWYIHGPDLCFRVAANGGLTCYHADGMGNVIRTSTAAGATRNQYAYTPYGRSISVPNNAPDADDPYRFVGSQGVMQELPNLCFMRARYYSAEAGMFLSTDPVENVGAGENTATYEYASVNPLRYNDPNGELFIVDSFFYGAIEGVVEAAVENMGKEYVIDTLADENVPRQDARVAVERAASIVDTARNVYDTYNIISRISTGYLPVDEVGRKFGGAAYHVGELVRDAVGNVSSKAGTHVRNAFLESSKSAAAPSARIGTTGTQAPMVINTALKQPQNTTHISSPRLTTSPTASTTATSSRPVSGGSSGSSITIRSGQTLSGIARDNHTTVARLVSLNPHVTNPNRIQAGGRLRIR